MRVISYVLAFDRVPEVTLKSLLRQTIKTRIVVVAAYSSACPSERGIECVVVPPNMSLSVGERVGISLTKAFHKFPPDGYDYFLKLDDDVWLDPKFLEVNISSNYDVMGRGAAMLIKTDCYVRVFDHFWPISPIDDTYVVETLMALGYKVLPFSWVKPALLMKEPRIPPSRAFKNGIEFYRLGLHPLRLATVFMRYVKNGGLRSALSLLSGYVYALLKRMKKVNYANEIYRNNIRYVIRKIAAIL